MAVQFSQVPNTTRVPATYYEIDGSRALGVQNGEPHTVLFLGLRLAAAPVAAGVITEVVGENDGDAYFDGRSQLASMLRAFKRVNKSARTYALAMDENAAGTAAAGTFVWAGSPTKDGTLTVRIGDQRVSCLLASGDTATQVSTKLNTAIGLAEKLMFTSGTSTATTTVTCRHKGECGNQVTIAVESAPAGVTCTVTQPTGGATNPSMATTIALIDDGWYKTIVTGLVDATTMLALENEAERREGPLVKRPCMVFGGNNGSHGTLTTYGSSRNSRHSVVMGSGSSPTPPWVWASQAAARDAQRCDTQPNQPRKGLTLPDCEAPAKSARFSDQQRNLLYYDGISSFTVDQSGRVKIDRLITTYQTNGAGLTDGTYLAVETMRNNFKLYEEYLQLGAKYEDSLLAPDGTNVGPGIKMVTPKNLRGEIIALNDSQERRGLVKDAKGFAESLIVELNATDVERMDANVASRLVGGLVTLAIKNSFQL